MNKLNIYRLHRPSYLAHVAEVFNRTCQFIEDFSIFIEEFYHIIV